MRSVLFLFAMLISLTTQPVCAAPASTQEIVDYVMGICFQQVDDIDRIKALARGLKWQRLPEEMMIVGKPVDAKDYDGWKVDYKGEILVVGVNRGTIEGGPVETCSVILPNRKQPDVIAAVQNRLPIRLLHTDNQGVQQAQFYDIQHHVLDRVLMQVLWPKDEALATTPNGLSSMTVLSFMGFR